MLRNWLKIAFKNYRKNWLSTLINLLGLTLGLTGIILMIAYWDYESSFEDWNPNKEKIYFAENEMSYYGYMPMSSAKQLRDAPKLFPAIESSVVYNRGSEILLKNGLKSFYGQGAYVSEGFFEFFPLKHIAGDFSNAFKQKNTVALSIQGAQRLFGDDYKNAIGSVILQEGKEEGLVLTAIYENPYEQTFIQSDILIRTTVLNDTEALNKNFSNYGFYKVQPTTNIQKLEDDLSIELRKITASFENQTEEDKKHTHVKLTRLDHLKLHSRSNAYNKTDIKTLKTLTALAFIILLLSSINVININTALAVNRAKEVGVRKALGSSKSAIMLQFIFEAMIFSVLALILSIATIGVILPYFNVFMEIDMDLDYVQLFYISILILFTIILFSGLIPAIYMANFKPIKTLKGNFNRSSRGIWLRNFILSFQIIFSSCFIIGSLIIHQQVEHIMNKDLGFDANQIVHINFNNDYYGIDNMRKYELIKDFYQKNPNVEDISYSFSNIGKWISASSIVMAIPDSTINSIAGAGAIDLNYFSMFDIPIIEGRDFNVHISSDTINNVIINESLSQHLGWNPADAIKKRIKLGFDGNVYNIIGVVKDFHISSLEEEISPMVFFYYGSLFTKNNVNGVDIKLKPEKIEQILPEIQKFFETEIEPGYPFDYYFVDKEFAKTFEKYQKQRTLFLILNGIVLLVALLGLFALSALMIEQKLKTVAIKKTLGASDRLLVFDLTKQFLIITAIAVLISIPISYYFMNEWLQDFAYRIDMPWWPYVLSLILLLVLTFLVVSIKAYRATQVNLIKYLKYE
ncbi:FtsX-like permease family protein [Flavobacteriaceae bacterium Ap0902]|nr:FtsX-like permease family protein [Flavobacteriaceae bacterium Ap0902]